MIGSSAILSVLEVSVLDRPMLRVFFEKPKIVTITPEEPTTLALALIAIGILAAYVALKRYARPVQQPGEQYPSTVSADFSRSGTPRRGAA